MQTHTKKIFWAAIAFYYFRQEGARHQGKVKFDEIIEPDRTLI